MRFTEDFTIMIADDDVDDQAFISEALRKHHFQGKIRCVNNGKALLQHLKHPAGTPLPGLILLDLNMPFKDGYEVLSDIKADAALKDIPAFVLTSSSRPEDENTCYSLGAEQFYRKPLSLKDYDRVALDILDSIGRL